MELRHLRYFVAVAEELHFGRAAQRLRMAQPPLSRQIRQLERDVGLLLLERTKRHVALTPAGRVLLDDARRLLAQAEEAISDARRAARGETGRLSVGFVGSATYDLLPQVLRVFHRRFPKVELLLHEWSSSVQQQAIVEGRLHIGFVRPAVLDDAIEARVMQREPMMLALPKGHRLTAETTVSLAALAREQFILFPREPRPSFADQVIEWCGKAGFIPRVVQETQELQTAVSLVAADIGITLVPASVRNVRRDNVTFKPLTDPAPMTELTAVSRKGDQSPVLVAFLGILDEVAGKGSARKAAGSR